VTVNASPAAFIENDAIGCYDRLVNNLILMLLKKLGLPPTVSKCMGELWDKVIHLIKTVYGISNISYASTPDFPLYGTGQGSTCGPLFCLLCYWVIVESIDPTISSLKFLSACQSVMVEVFGASFVDDSSLGVTSDYQYDPLLSESANREREISHVVTQLGVLAQHWECLLYSTGGAMDWNLPQVTTIFQNQSQGLSPPNPSVHLEYILQVPASKLSKPQFFEPIRIITRKACIRPICRLLRPTGHTYYFYVLTLIIPCQLALLLRSNAGLFRRLL
jgi:hypothetical protein